MKVWPARSEPLKFGSTTDIAVVFKVKFKYIHELSGRFSRNSLSLLDFTREVIFDAMKYFPSSS